MYNSKTSVLLPPKLTALGCFEFYDILLLSEAKNSKSVFSAERVDASSLNIDNYHINLKHFIYSGI